MSTRDRRLQAILEPHFVVQSLLGSLFTSFPLIPRWICGIDFVDRVLDAPENRRDILVRSSWSRVRQPRKEEGNGLRFAQPFSWRASPACGGALNPRRLPRTPSGFHTIAPGPWMPSLPFHPSGPA
jgi:hypothetical protein